MGDLKPEVEKLWNDTSTLEVDELEGWYHDDALWMVTCSCIIFNMQTGQEKSVQVSPGMHRALQ